MSSRENTPPARGTALVAALLVVALATVMAVALSSQIQFDVRRSASVLNSDQAYLYALGVEALSARILERDLRDSEYDHLGEDWAQIPPPLPVDGGQVHGRLYDLQARFNLNTLVSVAGERDDAAYERLRRLLALLELDPGVADAVVDWIDPDSEVSFPAGAEDGWYMGRDEPYLTANRRLSSVTELRLMRGVDAEFLRTLEPHVTALPEATPVNVNTASATVLAALVNGISVSEAEELIEGRGEQGYSSTADFLAHEVLAGEVGEGIETGSITVRSHYFLLDSRVELGQQRLRQFALIQRAASGARVLLRGQGAY